MIYNSSLKRAKILSIVTILLMSSIGIKLGYSCLFNFNNLSTLAKEEHERSFPLKASRGIIYDTNKNPLTYNESTLSLYIIPHQVKNKEEVLNFLVNNFEGDYEYFKNRLYQNI